MIGAMHLSGDVICQLLKISPVYITCLCIMIPIHPYFTYIYINLWCRFVYTVTYFIITIVTYLTPGLHAKYIAKCEIIYQYYLIRQKKT